MGDIEDDDDIDNIIILDDGFGEIKNKDKWFNLFKFIN